MVSHSIKLIAICFLFSGASIGKPTNCDNLLSEYDRFHSEYKKQKNFLSFIKELLRVETNEAKSKSKERNEKTLSDLDRYIPRKLGKSGEIGLTTEQLETLFRDVKNHPVASLDQLQKYDGGRGVGFCFGRAMTVHLEALFTYGVHNAQIRKLWVVGKMDKWQFHVATSVYTKDSGWMVVDPILNSPVTAKQWYKTFKKMDTRGDLLLFESEPKRFGASAKVYQKQGLHSDFYRDYFKDLLEHYQKSFSDKRPVSLDE